MAREPAFTQLITQTESGGGGNALYFYQLSLLKEDFLKNATCIFLVGKVLSSVSVQGQRVEANYLVFLVLKYT